MSLRLRALLFLAVVAAAAAALGVHIARGVPLQTNLLAMLPGIERDPLAEEVLTRLSAAVASRALFIVSHPDEDKARAGAEHLAAELRAAGGWRSLVARLPAFDLAAPVALYGERRFGLLAEADRDALTAGSFDLRPALLRQLVSPMGHVSPLPLARDPFGFFGRWLASLEPAASSMRLEDGYLTAHEGGRTRILVLGEVEGDVYDNAVQTRIVAGFARALAAVLSEGGPQTEVWRTGNVFFAAGARAAATGDMDRIAAGSVIGIAALMLLAFRSLRPLLLGLTSAGIGILFATLAVLALDGEVHLVTLAFGASLIGEAVDYSILLFAAHLAAGARWSPQQGVAAVRPGLTVAVATSLLAYSLLALVPFPGVSQVALFALVGLVAAFFTVLWLLPAFLARPSTRDPEAATRWAARFFELWSRTLRGRRALLLCAVLVAACIPGWLALRPNDDVRLLVPRDPQLLAQDEAIRKLTGFDAGGRFFLVRGADEEEVLARESALARRLRALERDGALAAHQAVSTYVPPRAAQRGDRLLARQRVFADREALQRALTGVGYRAEAAKQYIAEFERATRPVTVRDWLASPLSTPLRHLWAPVGEARLCSVVTLYGERDAARVAAAAQGLPGILLVDKAASVSQLLGRYRGWALPALLAAGCAMLIVLALRYGPREAPRVMLPVVLAEALSAAVFGYSGEPVTLFAVGGWTLALGIGVNYAIFLREGIVERAGATTMAVLLSGSTTLLSFGLLSVSSVAALRQFGFALATAIAAAVLLAPLALKPR